MAFSCFLKKEIFLASRTCLHQTWAISASKCVRTPEIQSLKWKLHFETRATEWTWLLASELLKKCFTPAPALFPRARKTKVNASRWNSLIQIEHMLCLAINNQNIAKTTTSNLMHCCGIRVADSKTEVFCKHLTKFSFTGNWAKKRGGDVIFWIQNDSEDLIFVFQPACRIPAWKVWQRMTSVHSYCYSSITRFTLNVSHTVTRLFTIQSPMYAHIIIHSHTHLFILTRLLYSLAYPPTHSQNHST